MKSRYDTISRILLLLTVALIGTAIMACGDATTNSQISDQHPEGTGGITVSLNLPIEEPVSNADRGVISDRCPDWGWPTVRVEVYDSDDTTLLRSEEFGCLHNNGRGTIAGIPVGSNRIFYAGLVVEGEFLFLARRIGIQVNEGQTTPLGEVDLHPYKPGAFQLTNASNSTDTIINIYYCHESGEFSDNRIDRLGNVIMPPNTYFTFTDIPQGNYLFDICWQNNGCQQLSYLVPITEGQTFSETVWIP
jgi:hypothetical protein